MAVVKRSKFWSYDFELFGRRYVGSTKRTNRKDAENAVSALRLRILNSVQGVPKHSDIPRLSELADRFIGWAEVNLSPATVVLHKVNVASLKKFFGGRLVTEIDAESVEKFKVWRASQKRKDADRNITAATVNRALTTLKRIYSYADSIDLALRNPVRRVKYLKESPGRMRVLTMEESDKYLEKTKGDLHDFAVIALDTGARPDEILSLHVEDVRQGEAHFHGTKTEKSVRDIPTTPAVRDILGRRVKESPNGFLFPVRRPKTKNIGVGHIGSLKKAHEAVIKKHFKDSPFVLYDLRHTFATRQVQLGTELTVLSALMGHSNITTTMRYIHPARQQKVEAIERMSQLADVATRFKKLLEELEAAVPEIRNWHPSPAKTTQTLGLDVEAAKQRLLESTMRP